MILIGLSMQTEEEHALCVCVLYYKKFIPSISYLE